MLSTTLFESAALKVVEYRCTAGPGDVAVPELHSLDSIAYVKRGTFGYRVRGRAHELVPGALLIGHAGDDYVCTHDHAGGGDECLAFCFAPALADEVGRGLWSAGSAPPRAELGVLAELALAAADGCASIGVDEVALQLMARAAEVATGRERAKSNETKVSAVDRRRAVRAALFIEAHASEPLGLQQLAAAAGLSSFHFLRVFCRVLGVSPHQYLLRVRLRDAARLLARDADSITHIALQVGFADLSNFVRSFRRAAGVSPGAFRRATDRKIFQDRIERG